MSRTLQNSIPRSLANRLRCGHRAWLIGMLICSGWLSSLAQVPISTENKIKATYLFNFPQFVEWPPEAYPVANSPFVIGILGTDPFGRFLDELTKGEKVGTHPIEIRRFHSLSGMDSCQLVYVSASEESRISAILQRLKNRPILSVGEGDLNFARRGGILSFYTSGTKVRFRANLQAAEAGKLKLSSKLLRMADLVPSTTPKE